MLKCLFNAMVQLQKHNHTLSKHFFLFSAHIQYHAFKNCGTLNNAVEGFILWRYCSRETLCHSLNPLINFSSVDSEKVNFAPLIKATK